MIENWTFDGFINHLHMVRDFYKDKRDCLLNIFDKHLTGLAEWDAPEAGMFVWVKIKGVPDVYDMVNSFFPKCV